MWQYIQRQYMIILSQHLLPSPKSRIFGGRQKKFFGADAPTLSSQNLHQISANDSNPNPATALSSLSSEN